MYLSDVGMLTSVYGMNTKTKILNNDNNLNGGGIYENAVAEELISKGFNVYYYNSKRQGELDFVIEYNGKLAPIEVKSGKDYTKHSALNNCLNNKEYGVDEGFVFANCNVSKEGKISYLPIYMASFMDSKKDKDYFAQSIVF